MEKNDVDQLLKRLNDMSFLIGSMLGGISGALNLCHSGNVSVNDIEIELKDLWKYSSILANKLFYEAKG